QCGLAGRGLELADGVGGRDVGRQRLPGQFLPVVLHPETEGGIVNTEFSRYLGDWQRVIDHFPGGLLLELRSISFSSSRHSIPFLSRRILLDPLSGNGGAPQGHRRYLIWHRTSAVVLCLVVTVAPPGAWHNPAPLPYSGLWPATV